MDIGMKIYNLRKQHGMTLEDVGNAVGVGKSTVRKWETGSIANMRRDKIAALAKLFDVSPSYLLGYEEKQQKKRIEKYNKLIEMIMRLDEIDRAKLEERAAMMLESDKYKGDSHVD